MEKSSQVAGRNGDSAFEMHALSAHRTPAEVEAFAKGAKDRGIKVIIAAAGMAAHLCGVIASMTTVPVIGVPINSTLDGMDALLAIVQMPPGIPVATVGINGALNAGILSESDACRRRRTTPGQAGRLQGKSEEKDRKKPTKS